METTRYILDRSFADSYDSRYFSNIINEHGFCTPIGSAYRVYAGALAALLISDNVPVTIDTKQSKVTWETIETTATTVMRKPTVTKSGESKPGIIRGGDFVDEYQTGYDQGREWFRKHFDPKPEVVYGQRAKSYATDLHNLYFHRPCGMWPDGLVSWKGVMKFVISPDNIREIGYHSGIIAEIETLAENHQDILDLAECGHKGTDKIPEHAKICLICIAQKEPISKTNAQLIAKRFGIITSNAGKKLKEMYDKLEDDTTRRNHRYIEKYLEDIRERVSGDALNWVANELSIIKRKKQ